MKISLNERQMTYLMDEFRIHQIVPEHNNITGGYVMVLHHLKACRSVLLLTNYTFEDGLQWNRTHKIPAVVIWADFNTVKELEALVD